MIKNKLTILLFFTFIISLTLVYSALFTNAEIIGGDFPYFYPEMVHEFKFLAPLWNPQSGLGAVEPSYSLFSYQNFIGSLFAGVFGISWGIVSKLFFFGLPIAFSIISIWYFSKKILGKVDIDRLLLSIFLYISNTYILMIIAGGQMGIALAYSVVPLVFATALLFVRSIPFNNEEIKIQNSKFKTQNNNSKLLRQGIILGMVLSLQIMFDIRIAYITMLMIGFYFPFHYFFIQKFNLQATIYNLLFTFFIILGLHAYWIIPFTYYGLLDVPEGITNIQGFNFFSFADFSHSISFLHPNWPENIFGKIYFLKPEFILLPILAFSSLLFLVNLKFKTQNQSQQHNTKNFKNNIVTEQYYNSIILFFVLLGLIGVFLAKGSNPPFGEINNWLFIHFPGMNLFRDPTKFYILIAFPYSIIIPFSVTHIAIWGEKRFKNKLISTLYKRDIFILLVSIFTIFLVRESLTGELNGTFKHQKVPDEYVAFKNKLTSQPEFFRTLWIPTQSRFRFQSENHPLLNANYLFKTSSESALIKKLDSIKTKNMLSDYSIKYVVIPFDSTSEIFLDDRKYSSKKRVSLEKKIDSIKWLKKINSGNISIYENSGYKDHFFLENKGSITYIRKDESSYTLSIKSSSNSFVIFSEQYSPHWKISVDNKLEYFEKTSDSLIRFAIKPGEHMVSIYFEPQRWLKYTYSFSIIVLIISLFIRRKIADN